MKSAETEYAVLVSYQMPDLVSSDSHKQKAQRSSPDRKLQAES